MRSAFFTALTAVAPLAVAACSDSPIATPLHRDLAPRTSSASAIVPVNVLGIGVGVTGRGHACSSPEYRQFDFWLGKWDAYIPTGSLSGTDVVTTRLGGCAVEESWTDGGRGRSLNVYDASLKRWTQFWVYSGGGAFTPLLLEGEFVGGEMRMAYDRTSPTGLFIGFPPPGAVRFRLLDDYSWHADPSDGSVVQSDMRAFDAQPASLAFTLRYKPVQDVTPIPVGSFSVCQVRAANRQFDFMLGTWDVYAGEGNGKGAAQGTATFTTDLGSCLVEEHLAGAGDYQGWSFNSWSVFTRQWHRTYVDSEGNRIALSGGLSDGRMILSGVEPSPGGPVTVRVTWDPKSASEVLQTWEFSRDGGISWLVRQDLTYIRHS